MNKQNFITNSCGSSLMSAIVIMAILTLGMMATLSLRGMEFGGYINGIRSDKAALAGDAGVAYAVYKLDRGFKPDIEDMEFDGGKFSVTSDPISKRVVVNSSYDSGKKTQSFRGKFSEDCTHFDKTIPIKLSGDFLNMMRLWKVCNQEIIFDKMTVSWNSSECATDVLCPGEPAFDGSCFATPETQAQLQECPVEDAGVKVVQINFSGIDLFNANAQPTPEIPPVASGQLLDFPDVSRSEDVPNDAFIYFDQNLPDGSWVELVMHYADGSSIASKFRASNAHLSGGGQPQPSGGQQPPQPMCPSVDDPQMMVPCAPGQNPPPPQPMCPSVDNPQMMVPCAPGQNPPPPQPMCPSVDNPQMMVPCAPGQNPPPPPPPMCPSVDDPQMMVPCAPGQNPPPPPPPMCPSVDDPQMMVPCAPGQIPPQLPPPMCPSVDDPQMMVPCAPGQNPPPPPPP